MYCSLMNPDFICEVLTLIDRSYQITITTMKTKNVLKFSLEDVFCSYVVAKLKKNSKDIWIHKLYRKFWSSLNEMSLILPTWWILRFGYDLKHKLKDSIWFYRKITINFIKW